VRIFKSKRNLIGSKSTPTPSVKVDELLRRHQQQDSNEPHGDPLDAEVRLLTTLVLMSDVDPLTREIYIAARSGHTYPEIAAAWGVSVFTVKKCVARGLLEIMKIERMKR
jgi:DNA-directed RNA polymerase specialized sigma24 family protein